MSNPQTQTPIPVPIDNTLLNLEWVGNAATGYLSLLDQTLLPRQENFLACRTVESVGQALKNLSVRGAPAIGIAAAYGCVIAAQNNNFSAGADYLATSRPTAINLCWAISRMKASAQKWYRTDTAETPPLVNALLEEARSIHQEDRDACRNIGLHALQLLRELTGAELHLLTHCNAGALATGGIGTATAPMYLAHEQGLPLSVFATETRPLLQGARLTAYELQRAKIAVTILTDSMAAVLMQAGKVRAVITGADRIAANGDTANKIGTYGLAVLAKHHHLPFVVAAPTTTFDLQTPTGAEIPIEERSPEEITEGFGWRTAPLKIATFSPAFDVTPAELITALISERGIIRPITPAAINAHLA